MGRNALGKLVVDSAEATGVIDIYRQAGIESPNLQDLITALQAQERAERLEAEG